MKTKVYIQNDFGLDGLRIAIVRDYGGPRTLLTFGPPTETVLRETGEEVEWGDHLGLRTEDARALYEALAEHFGHTGHDIRALRKDYEHERARVDKLLDYAMTPPLIFDGTRPKP